MVKKQNFLQGAAILAAGVAIVKIIGFLSKIPLVNILGGEGFGHYTVAYNIYGTLLVISTQGLPVAISKLVAEANVRGRGREIKKIVRIAMLIFLLVGGIGSLGMFLFAPQLAGLYKSPQSVYAIQAIAPSVFFLTVISALRGYYQGMTNMYPTAISQIIEALGKLMLGVSFAWYLQQKGYPGDIVAAGAVLGMTLGTVISMLYLVLRKVFDRNPPTGVDTQSHSGKEIAQRILAIAIPVTIGSGLLSLTNTIDSMLCLVRLQTSAGFVYDKALFLTGSYAIAQTMFNFPAAFIMSFAISVVPSVATAISRGDKHGASRTIETAIRLTSILSLPAAVGLSVLSWPILNLLFSSRPDEVSAAALPLSILGIAVFFNCVVLLTNAVLQSVGKANIPVYTMLFGSVVKIVTNWFLVGTPSININGAPIGTCLCYLTIMALNLIAISREVKPAPNLLRMFGRPLIATVIMGAAAWAVNGLLANFISAKIAVLGAIAVACVIYLILIILMKILTREDLMLLPKGEKIARILRIH